MAKMVVLGQQLVVHNLSAEEVVNLLPRRDRITVAIVVIHMLLQCGKHFPLNQHESSPNVFDLERLLWILHFVAFQGGDIKVAGQLR